MNETIQQLYDRKSCRMFTGENIPSEARELILNAALQAPTAGNMSLYTILDIQDAKIKERLAENCDHQTFIAKAPMVLLFLADYQKWATLFEAYGLDTMPDGPGDFILAVEDTMIAAHNAVVAAESLGIHSCYIGDIIEQYEANRDLLNLPAFVMPVCLVVFGYPAESQIRREKPKRFKLEDMVSIDTYPDRTAKQAEDMLMRKMQKSREEVKSDVNALYHRKIDCDFHREMNRSVTEMLKAWGK